MTVRRTPVALDGHNLKSVGTFVVSEGQTVPFVLTYGHSYRPLPDPIDPIAALNDTEAFWRDWSAGCCETGKWSALVRRSLITLKALTYRPPAASWRRRPPRCPSNSAERVIGTIAFVGSGMQPSPC